MEGHQEFILSRSEISKEVVHAKDCFGYTPLHLAIRHSRESVMQLLTTPSLVLPDRFLATTSEPDDLGWNCGDCTPLHWAVMRGHIAIAKLLLQKPCQVEFAYNPVNLHAVTWDGKTLLDVAQKRFYPTRLEGISFHGLGFTFQEARRQDYLKLVKLLALSDLNWLQQYRERTAICGFGGSAYFGSWLQPLRGIPVPDSGSPSPSPSTFESVDKYWNPVFYICVAFAFTFSVVALTIGTLGTLLGTELSSQDNVM